MIDRSNKFSFQLTIVCLLLYLLQREEHIQNVNSDVQWEKYCTTWKETWVLTQDSFSKKLHNRAS